MAFNLTGTGAASITSILKTNYQGPVREQVNRRSFLADKVHTAKNVQFVGNKSYIPLSVGYNAGTGPRDEQKTLPTAGSQKYDNANFDQRYLYGVIEVSGPAMAATKNDKGAFVRALRSEMDGLIKNVGQMQNRMFWADGSGILTGCVSKSGAALTVNDTGRIFAGMSVDLVTKTTGAAINAADVGLSVSSVDSKTVATLGSSITGTVDTTTAVILNGTEVTDKSRANPSDPWGIEAIVAAKNPGDVNDVYHGANTDGTEGIDSWFGEIDRDANLFWQANVIGNSGTNRDLTLDLMQQAYDESEIEGDARPGAILTNHALKRRFAALLVADRRYTGGTTPFEGDAGWRGLEFNDAVVLSDKDAGNTLNPGVLNAMYFLTMSHLEMHISSDWQWMQEDGAILDRTGKDAYSAIYRAYKNLVTDRPNAHSKLDDLSETA